MTNTKNVTEEDAALVMSLSGAAEATCSFIISIIGMNIFVFDVKHDCQENQIGALC